jgi:hypothetical protein
MQESRQRIKWRSARAHVDSINRVKASESPLLQLLANQFVSEIAKSQILPLSQAPRPTWFHNELLYAAQIR